MPYLILFVLLFALPINSKDLSLVNYNPALINNVKAKEVTIETNLHNRPYYMGLTFLHPFESHSYIYHAYGIDFIYTDYNRSTSHTSTQLSYAITPFRNFTAGISARLFRTDISDVINYYAPINLGISYNWNNRPFLGNHLLGFYGDNISAVPTDINNQHIHQRSIGLNWTGKFLKRELLQLDGIIGLYTDSDSLQYLLKCSFNPLFFNIGGSISDLNNSLFLGWKPRLSNYFEVRLTRTGFQNNNIHYSLLINKAFGRTREVTYAKKMARVDKPIIYLYPSDTTFVSVTLNFITNGEFIYTYPSYKGGWNVKAYPDGTLEDSEGKFYYSLFWEGTQEVSTDDSTGFIIHRDSLNSFFETTLEKLGLNYKEKQEFIIYWVPRLMKNEYSFIHFSRSEYGKKVELNVTPEPETINRFLMLYRKAYNNEIVTPQILTAPKRDGFTLIEWGGAELVENAIKD